MSSGRNILVLYRVANSDSDNSTPNYNCFNLPYGSGATLSRVKQHCAAAHHLNVLGPEGYHWRVLVEDKAGEEGERAYSWWDIQDGNAKLPIKQCSQHDVRRLLHPGKSVISGTDSASKAAKGAFKMMGKMAESVVGGEAESTGPPVAVITFKLVDLVKLQDEMDKRGPPPPRQPRARPAPRPRATPAPKPRAQAPAGARPGARPQQAAQRAPAPRQQHQQQRAQTGSLLDFGGGVAPSAPTTGNFNPKVLHHTHSAPPVPVNESRAQRLKREQEKKMKTSNRVWDDIDQRWVEAKPQTPAPGAVATKPKGKVVGVKLDGSSGIGKSVSVQAGVNKRVNEMKEAQQKALEEVREREAKKKRDEDEEDIVRKQLEPKIKAWAEEHGKKKQIRALLGTLHIILWPGAKWKQIGIGDLLEDKKVKRAFHKATLVVHPDKTHDLPPDQRFLAKRIFDALSQAKTEFDNGN
ncbi:unnamed protein product [Cylindrotheca closterium]|uniref:J domain-containing protein n=1 Tax=Cylindrotheca closterium TaxID=2856 RepID=A0AAD2FLC5_9STRA|nr:unnamed protein product [Cylindrotheca closterium]